MPLNAPLSADLSSDSFHDKDIRLRVQVMEKKTFPNGDQERASKRRKVSRESESTLFVMHRLCKVLEIPPKSTNALADIEDILM